MKDRTNFFWTFEQKIAKCDDRCNHYYVKHIYKDSTVHYDLHCVRHGWRCVVPREFALEGIQAGGVVVPYENRKINQKQYDKILKERESTFLSDL